MGPILPAHQPRQNYAKMIGDQLSEGMKNYFQSQASSKENAALKRAGFDVEGLSPEMKKVYVSAQLQGANAQQLQSIKEAEKNQRLEKSQQFVESIYQKRGQQPTKGEQLVSGESPDQTSEESLDTSRSPLLDITDEEIAQASVIDPNLARVLQSQRDVALRESRKDKEAKERLAREERAAKTKKEEILGKETLPYRTELVNRAAAAERGLENKKELNTLIDTGNIDDPTYIQFLEMLPGKMGARFLSPETVMYKGALVSGYADLKNIFTGATRVKEIEILENKIADVYYTDQQKKAILKSMAKSLDQDVVKGEVLAEIEAEGKPLGLSALRKEVDKRAKQSINALFDRVLDEQKAILQDAENIKKMPLNLNNPEHIEIIDQILEENGGDPERAMEAAKRKGYTWESMDQTPSRSGPNRNTRRTPQKINRTRFPTHSHNG